MESSSVISKSNVIAEAATPLYLAEFSNGNVKEAKKNSMVFQSYKSCESNFLKRPKKILVTNGNRLQYAGCNYGTEVTKSISSMLKVGVLNKNTGMLKLYDVDYFRLKPLLKCHVDVNEEKKTWEEQTGNLIQAFGTKTRKRILNSKLKNNSAANDRIPIMNENDVKESILTDTKVSRITNEVEEIVPPQNKNATTASEIYNIHDIISKEEFYALESSATDFVSATYDVIQKWKKDNTYSVLITSCIETKLGCLSLSDAKLLCYLHYMMCLVKLTYKDFRKKDPIPDVPKPFKQKLLQRFLFNRSMPQRMKDKLIAHSMILALVLNNYQVDCKLLAMSSKISIKRLVMVAYLLGCHVQQKKNEDSKLISLKLPLYKYEPHGRLKKN